MYARCRPIAMLIAGLGFAMVAGLPEQVIVAGAYATEQGSVVRPEIGKPILAAQGLLKNKKGKEALAKLRETDAVRDKTPYEAYVVERIQAQAAAAAGEAALAARAFEAAAASPVAPEGERAQLLAAAAGQYYLLKNYSKSAELASRYFKSGGRDQAIRTLYIQTLYLGNDFSRVIKELQVDIQAEEQAGRPVSEEQLQLLANAYLGLKDNAGYANTLEKLVARYPKRDYWIAVIHAAISRANFSERLAADVGRLKLATDTLRTDTEYVEMAQLSLQAGCAAEAQKIIDRGYAATLLGTGADAERHKRLKDMAARNLAEEQRSLAQTPAAGDAKALVDIGFRQVINGQADKGLALMEQGIRKGGLKRPDDARLHLGYAYYLAGQKQKALQVLKTVQGADGPAALARLWIIRLGQVS